MPCSRVTRPMGQILDSLSDDEIEALARKVVPDPTTRKYTPNADMRDFMLKEIEASKSEA